MTDARLSRMEDKLDKLYEAIISMARMEERLVSVIGPPRLVHVEC
jgi:vacuolar-type H+-ATPase subunit E/Vma4